MRGSPHARWALSTARSRSDDHTPVNRRPSITDRSASACRRPLSVSGGLFHPATLFEAEYVVSPCRTSQSSRARFMADKDNAARERTILDARFSMLDARFSMLDSRFSMLDAGS
jgi:hypothetical protein